MTAPNPAVGEGRTSATIDPRWAIHNPNNLPVADLPVIYGFNNGGSPGWYFGVLLAADGEELGSHLCSSEGYMQHDLGCFVGSRPDRHETFREHYPDGYRMEFVPGRDVQSHAGLDAACKRAEARALAASVPA